MLSVCIITKNEEKNIGRCLQSFQKTGYEMIVVDTGSTDRTKEIARQYTHKLYEFPWSGDFAAARNFALSKAGSPYVMMIDSDEYLESMNLPAFEELLRKHPHEVGRIYRKNRLHQNGILQEQKEWLNRVFPKGRFCYEGRIHEQIVSTDGGTYETYETPIVIVHTGYDLALEQKKQKAERNAALLKAELKDLEERIGKDKAVEEKIPYLLYQLGKSHYMAEEYESACHCFSQALSYDLNPKLEYVADMVETYGYALLNSGQAESALLFENIYGEFSGSADFLFLMGLIYMNNARFEDAIQEFLKAASRKACKMTGVNSYAAYYNIGVIYECLGKLEQAKSYYEKCGSYEPALARLRLMAGGDLNSGGRQIGTKKDFP